MKLNREQIDHVRDQTGLDPVSEDHALYSDLADVFGHQTYYLVEDGLLILQRQGTNDSSADGVTPASFWKLASWADEDRSELVTHAPEELDVVIDLEPPDPDPAA